MPKFHVNVPHTMGKQAATEKLKHYMDRVSEMYRDQVKDVTQTWHEDKLDFGFKTLGMRMEGTMVVEETEVDVTGNIPMAAMMFKGKIESSLREQLTKMLR